MRGGRWCDYFQHPPCCICITPVGLRGNERRRHSSLLVVRTDFHGRVSVLSRPEWDRSLLQEEMGREHFPLSPLLL